ncbi:S-adenosyl-L-methionine-dependent methyltransferase [Agrocybe pediades]|nr:S-adenosyl-L-methionine-dependent methyltransferase [Agrocybe pediades]
MSSYLLRCVARWPRPGALRFDRALLSIGSQPEFSSSMGSLAPSNFRLMSRASRAQEDESSSQNSISSLVRLINESAKVIEEHYAKSSTTVPSLDSITAHPLDEQIMSNELRLAVQTVKGACAQLADTVGKPDITVLTKLMEHWYTTCMFIAQKYKLPDILQEKPDGMHVSEIEEKTGIHQHKVGRILRLLVSKHTFKEVSEDVFANNRLSMRLLSIYPLTDFGLHVGDEAAKSGDDPVGSQRGARFGRGMMGWTGVLESNALVSDYPWHELPSNASFCDVGSGVGTMSMELAKAHRNLRFVLHDKPERLKQAEHEVWPKLLPGVLAERRIEFVPLDFMKESPKSGCDVYFLKNIIHDWSDEEAITILKNVRDAMAPHSRVLLQEYILPPGHRVSDKESGIIKQAPEPLLPNYGAGLIQQYCLDIHILNLLNGQVRTLAQYIKLGEAAGLKFVKLREVGQTGVVEYIRE